jgi:hypothetical protein
MSQETSAARETLFQQLMTVPHGVLGPMVAAFQDAMRREPDFTARACVHLNQGGSNIRDQQEAAILALLLAPSAFPEYREAGRCLLLGSDVYPTIAPDRLPGLPPFRILRVWHHLVSRHVVFRDGVEVQRFRTRSRAENAVPRIANRLAKGKQDEAAAILANLTVGRDETPRPSRLGHDLMWDWWRMLEENPRRADGVVVDSRRMMKEVCRSHGFNDKDFPYLRALLYAKEPPPDSKVAVIKRIAHSDSPKEQARLAIEHKIPYLALASAVGRMSPVLAVALIGAMSPAEARNSRAWVEDSGLLQVPEVKRIFVEKVARADQSAATIAHRKSARGDDAEVEAAMQSAREKAVQKMQRIEQPTALCIDKSGSLSLTLDVGTAFGAHIGPLCDDLICVIFDDAARVVSVQGTGLAAWETALRGVRPGGGTSMSAAWNVITQAGFEPGQLIFVTDGGERHGPQLAPILARKDVPPHVVVIRVPGNDDDWFTGRLQGADLLVDKFEVGGKTDYYLFDQIAAVLGGPRALRLAERIAATELPRRVKVEVPEVL